jgi:hypothetical protein
LQLQQRKAQAEVIILAKMNKKSAANTGFASGGVTCKLGALCFYSSSVVVESFALRNPPERKALKRWLLLLTTLFADRK